MFELAPLDSKISSPNKTYKIELKEQIVLKDSFLSCYGNHSVKMSVEKNQQPLITDEIIYSGDGMDGRFGKPNAFWLSENVLSFYGQPTDSAKRDEVKVINQTDKTINYLIVNANAKYIIFDLLPHNEFIIPTTSQSVGKKSLSWIDCFGKFADNKSFKKGVNFEVSGQNVSITHYTIKIEDFGVEIESEEFKQLDNQSLPNQTSSKELISEL